MVYPGMIPGMPPPMGVPPFAVSARANLARSSQPFIGWTPFGASRDPPHRD
jgi:hypothetical protein